MGMLGVLGMYARVRTKVRKGLGGVSYSLVYSVPGIKKKKSPYKRSRADTD